MIDDHDPASSAGAPSSSTRVAPSSSRPRRVGSGPSWCGTLAGPTAANAAGPLTLELGGTDGWISLPPTPAIPPFHPDSLAPEAVDGDAASQLTTYIFGFRNVTGLSETREVRPEEQGAAQRAADVGGRVRRQSPPTRSSSSSRTSAWRSGPTSSTPTRCTGTGSRTPSPTTTASPRARSPCRPGGRSSTPTARATPGPTCTTATSRTWSTSRWA